MKFIVHSSRGVCVFTGSLWSSNKKSYYLFVWFLLCIAHIINWSHCFQALSDRKYVYGISKLSYLA